MNLLFPIQPTMPAGFTYYPDFISREEEASILPAIEKLDLKPLIFQGFEAKRKTGSFGYSYHFDSRTISKGKPIPPELNFVIDRIASLLSVSTETIAQVLVTEYPEGSVINWHRDAPPFDIIIGLSLQSDCSFRFRPYDKAKQTKKAILSMNVARRSLYIMRDEARSEWEHSISPVESTRYSITFRTLRDGYG